MDIEIGDYIRTYKGQIYQIIGLNIDNEFVIDGYYYGGNYLTKIEAKEKVKKHSKNIIDLIEIGDYIDGEKVVAVDYTEDEHGNYVDTLGIMEIDDDYAYPIELRVLNIKSIVTKEQFERIMYKVE